MSEDSHERAERKSHGAGKGMVFGAGIGLVFGEIPWRPARRAQDSSGEGSMATVRWSSRDRFNSQPPRLARYAGRIAFR